MLFVATFNLRGEGQVKRRLIIGCVMSGLHHPKSTHRLGVCVAGQLSGSASA